MISKESIISKINSQTEENEKKIQQLEALIDKNILERYSGCNEIWIPLNSFDTANSVNIAVKEQIIKRYEERGWRIDVTYDTYYGYNTIRIS